MQPEVRMARYVEALERYRGGRLSCVEAAELLGISERHFRRLRERYEAAGAEGLIDRPLKPARRQPCGFVDNALRYPQPHRAINNRSGHIMCYENRTSLRASDTVPRPGSRMAAM